MDSTTILYIIKASIAISLFYGIYIFFLRKDTFNRVKRFYLLFAIGASLLLPLCNINVNMLHDSTGILTEAIIPQISITPERDNVTEILEENQGLTINFSTIIFYTLVSGVVLLFIRLVIQLLSILKIRMNNNVLRDENVRMILMNENAAPFSFFNWIFLPKKFDDEKDWDIMVAHEKIHSQQKHSFDVLISELFCIFFWWNPVSWLIKREIQVNLEYLADEGVLRKGYEPKAYQYLLLQITNSNASIQIVNYFNVSQLKKRIIMINKEKSKKVLTAKYLLILPVALVMILVNIACSETDKTLSTDENNAVAAVVEPEVKVAEVKEVVEDTPVEKMKPFQTVEVMPIFPGGDSQLLKYISENLKYPEVAEQNKTEGLVVVRFVVSELGKVSDVEIIRSVSPECDAEAVRVVRSMPQWTPGKQKGQNVPVYYTLPIRFKLQK